MVAINSDILTDIGLGPAQNPQGPRKNNAEDLGVNEFMTLMLAQIQNQDPFEPMQNGEFISQLAEFGTVSGIDQLQQSFTTLSESLFSNQALEAASLIGRHVQVDSNMAVHIQGDIVTGAIELPDSASSVTVRIYNQSGQQVDSISFGEQAPGTLDFAWDGLTTDGAQAATGLYKVTAEALIEGETTGLDTYLDVPVGSVSFNSNSGGIELELANGETIKFTQVREIK